MSLVKLAFADPAQDFTLRLHLRRPHPARLGHQVRPQLGPRPDPRGGRDQPAHPEARLRHVRRRPRPARHEGGARPRGRDALEAARQALLRDGRARLLPRPRRVLVEALRPALLQLRPQGRALRRAQQHPHLRRVDLQPLAVRRAAHARDGRARQPERLAVHGGREAARLAQGRPRQGRQDDAGRGLLALAAAEALQGLELLDRRRRGGAGAARAVRQGQRDLRPRAPDPVQPDRQHLVQRGDGDGLALALPAAPTPRPSSTMPVLTVPDEPRRPVLRARRDGLAVHRRAHRPRRRSSTTSTTTPTAPWPGTPRPGSPRTPRSRTRRSASRRRSTTEGGRP